MARKCLFFVQWWSVLLCGCDWGGRYVNRDGPAGFCRILGTLTPVSHYLLGSRHFIAAFLGQVTCSVASAATVTFSEQLTRDFGFKTATV